jgi:hypothetical protein
LPCPYFLVTFPLPQSLRAFVRSHQQVAYEALFQASVSALRALASDGRLIGADKLGMFRVLHTWGRQVNYHPHIHYVVPGGGLSKGGRQWRPCRAEFFLPVKALSMLYREAFCRCMERAGLLDQIDPAVWNEAWVVDSRAVGDGRSSLRYLAPYVFRVAVSNGRIVSCEDGKVVLLWKKSGSQRWRRMTLDAMEFIRRFLQHVLPPGFRKVRHYGFLNAASNTDVAEIRELIADYYQGFAEELSSAEPDEDAATPGPVCPHCGRPMRFRSMVLPEAHDPVVILDTG